MDKRTGMSIAIRIFSIAACIVLLSFAGAARAQVEIMDSMSVSTMMDTTNAAVDPSVQSLQTIKGFSKGLPGTVSSIGPGKKVDALITLPEGGGLTVTIIGGAAAAQLDLILRSPVQEMLVADGNHHHGFTWDTTGVAAGTTFDFGLIWRWWGLVGTEYGCVVQQVNDSTYILGFEDRGTPPMYVDLILQVVVHTGPELVIIYPTDELKDMKDITADPMMPAITLKAQLKNYNGGTVNFQWNLRVQWEGDDGRQFDTSFPDDTTATNSDVSSWTVNWNSMIRGGDEITLDVTATAGGKVYDKTINHPFLIVGDNPTIDDVKTGLTLQQQVVVYLESLPHWKHFRSDGFPIFGKPHGYGLMQLDKPPATDQQVWDWKENREEGSQRLAKKFKLAEKYGTEIRDGVVYRDNPIPGNWYGPRNKPIQYKNATNFVSDEQVWKDTFQRYNGGVYWRWLPENPRDVDSRGAWVASPPPPHPGHSMPYGDEAWSIYKGLQSGIYPSGWN